MKPPYITPLFEANFECMNKLVEFLVTSVGVPAVIVLALIYAIYRFWAKNLFDQMLADYNKGIKKDLLKRQAALNKELEDYKKDINKQAETYKQELKAEYDAKSAESKHAYDKKLEEYKSWLTEQRSDYESILSKQLASHQHELGIMLSNHQTKFAVLHENRALAIKEILSILKGLLAELKTYTEFVSQSNTPALNDARDKFEPIKTSITQLTELFKTHDIYFSEKTYQGIQKTLHNLDKFQEELAKAGVTLEDQLVTQVSNIHQEFVAIYEDLLKTFRKILGVDEED